MDGSGTGETGKLPHSRNGCVQEFTAERRLRSRYRRSKSRGVAQPLRSAVPLIVFLIERSGLTPSIAMLQSAFHQAKASGGVYSHHECVHTGGCRQYRPAPLLPRRPRRDLRCNQQDSSVPHRTARGERRTRILRTYRTGRNGRSGRGGILKRRREAIRAARAPTQAG
jgi:hypothetical protein